MSVLYKLLESSKASSTRLRTLKILIEIILPLLKPILPLLIFTYIIMLCHIGVSLLIPKYSGNIIDLVTRSRNDAELKDLCIKIFLVTITNHYLQKLANKMRSKSFKELDYYLKSETYKRLLECELEYFDQKTWRELKNLLDVGIHGYIKLWFYRSKTLFEAIGSFCASLYVMYQTFPKLMFVALGGVSLTFALQYFLKKKTNPSGKRWEETQMKHKLTTLPKQAIENILLVKTFSTEAKEHKEYVETQDDLAKSTNQSEAKNWLFETMTLLLEQLSSLVLIWYGGVLIFQGKITVGEFSIFNMYTVKFNSAVSKFKNEFGILKDDGYSASVSEFIQMILKNEEIKVQLRGKMKTSLEGNIEIKDISFSYITKPDVKVLSGVSLSIKKGQSVAIVGANGSGKTTLSYLLQGLYAPKQGVVIIDGEDIQNYDLKWLRKQIGYVSQEPVLLNKTIEKNLVYGLHGEDSQEQIERALTLANARFVLDAKKFPDGLQTRLGRGDKSVNLSGGQRQRVAIARAFIKDPKILILDEPTSALDGESESKVQKAIDELMALGERTVIVIAHRLSTIINCDKIVVMDEGKIVEEGTHKELFAKEGGVYKKLFEFQINSMKKNV